MDATEAQVEAAARAVDTWTAERLDFVLSSSERDSLARAALTAAAQVQPAPRTVSAAEIAEARAEGWWEGVNDQWKTRPIGKRMLETENPFRGTGDDRG